MQKIRGAEIALIFQEPMTALNPVFTIGNQIEETLRVHGRATRRTARQKAIELLDAVQHSRAAEARARLPASALRRPAAARAHRDVAGVRAVARDCRRTDDRARRHHPGANPRPASRRCKGAWASRCSSSRTISASSRRWPTASPSCMPDGSSRRRRCDELFARPETSVHARPDGVDSRRSAGHAAARDPGDRAAARRTCRPAARSRRDARIGSSRARRRTRARRFRRRTDGEVLPAWPGGRTAGCRRSGYRGRR